MAERVETPYMKIWLEEGILYCTFNDKLEMNLDIARHCVSARIAFSQGKSYPCLINMKGVKTVTKEARNYLAVEGSQLIKAGALIVGSALTRMLGNIFILVNKPGAPTKLFTSEKEAKEWLMPFTKT